MAEWYIIFNGQQVGPMSKEQLMSYDLNAQSKVWREGMPQWVDAFTVPELMQFINRSQGASPQPQQSYQMPQQSQQFGQGMYSPQVDSQTNVCAIIGMVLGILSLVLIFVPVVGILFAVAGLICSLIGRKRPGNRGMATAGLICSIITLSLFVLGIILGILIGASFLAAFL